jgi:hypothetical protein
MGGMSTVQAWGGDVSDEEFGGMGGGGIYRKGANCLVGYGQLAASR